MIDGVIEFLSGNDRPIRAELERQMRDAAAEERFEDAARYRNRLHAVERLAERQAVERASIGTIDVIGLAVGPERAAVQVFPLRERADGRPLLVPPRERRRRRPARGARGLLHRVLRRGAVGAAADPRAARPRRPEHARGLPLRAARLAGRGARAGARREAAAAGARPAERRAGALVRDARSPRRSGCAASRRSRSCARC